MAGEFDPTQFGAVAVEEPPQPFDPTAHGAVPVQEPPKEEGGVLSGVASAIGSAINPINLVKGALGLGQPSDISNIIRYGKTLGEIVTGTKPDVAIGQNIPELQQEREAVFGQRGTKAQAEALTGIGLQLGLVAAPFVHGKTLLKAPSLTEVAEPLIGRKVPSTPMEAATEPITSTEGVPNAVQEPQNAQPYGVRAEPQVPQETVPPSPSVGGEGIPTGGQGETLPAYQGIKTGTPETPNVVEPTLPHDLRGAKPRYNYGSKGFELQFESDIDKASYISAQKNKSKADARYVQFVSDSTGLSEAQIRDHGAQVRAVIKEQARTSPEGLLQIPRTVSEHRPSPEARQGTEAQPPQAEVAAPTIKDLVDRYDAGDEKIQTVRDLVDEVDVQHGDNPKVAKAVEKYRSDQEENMQEFGGRGDEDQIESDFLNAIQKVAEKPAPVSEVKSGTTASSIPKTGEVSAPKEEAPTGTGISNQRLTEAYGDSAPVATTGKGPGAWKDEGLSRLDSFQKTGDVKNDPYSVLTNLREGTVPVSQLPSDVSLLRAEHQRLLEDARNAEGTPEYQAKSQAALDMATAIKGVAHGPASDVFRALQEYDKPRYDNVTDFDQALRERENRESTSIEKNQFKKIADDVSTTRNGAEKTISDVQKRISKFPRMSFDEAAKNIRDQFTELTKDCGL